MSFTRFQLGFTRSRKVNALPDAGFRLWVSAVDYAREQRTDGEILPLDLDTIPHCPPRGKHRVALVNQLVALGLWDEKGEGWQIHDFLDWQDSAEVVNKKREQARERMRSVRANIKRTSREVHSTDHLSISSSLSDLGSRPEPEPTQTGTQPPTETTDLAERAKRVLANPYDGEFQQPSMWLEVQTVAKAWSEPFGIKQIRLRNNPSSDADLRAILAAFADGYTVAQCLEAAANAPKNEWLSSRKNAGPACFTATVLRRLLQDSTESGTMAVAGTFIPGKGLVG